MTKTVDLHDAKKPVDQEELDRLAKEEEEKLKKKKEDEDEEEIEEEEDVEEEEDDDEEEEEQEEETDEEKTAREQKEKEEADKKKAEDEKDKKLKASQKEAMIWKKKAEDLEAEKTKKVVVDDAFLKEKYPDWEDMTIGEQRAIRVAEEGKMELAEINRKTNEFNNDKKWTEKVNDFVENELPEQFPKLKGKEEDFKKFATKPTRKGMPLDDLAKIFIVDNPEVEKNKPKRSLFHANGGVDKRPVKKGWTAEEVEHLRKTNNKKYMELIRKKEIKLDF